MRGKRPTGPLKNKQKNKTSDLFRAVLSAALKHPQHSVYVLLLQTCLSWLWPLGSLWDSPQELRVVMFSPWTSRAYGKWSGNDCSKSAFYLLAQLQNITGVLKGVFSVLEKNPHIPVSPVYVDKYFFMFTWMKVLLVMWFMSYTMFMLQVTLVCTLVYPSSLTPQPGDSNPSTDDSLYRITALNL